jgi:hypothetical protein
MDLLHRLSHLFKHKPSLTMDLADNAKVRYQHTITGRVEPHHAKVQVIVRSADGHFYLQKDADVRPNGKWSVVCTFGFPSDTDSLHEYLVVAFIGDKMKVGRVDRTPPMLTSRVRTVTRIS